MILLGFRAVVIVCLRVVFLRLERERCVEANFSKPSPTLRDETGKSSQVMESFRTRLNTPLAPSKKTGISRGTAFSKKTTLKLKSGHFDNDDDSAESFLK